MQFNLTPVVRNLLIINILVFFIQSNSRFVSDHIGLHYILSPGFAPYQFLTYMFGHGSLSHLFSNMFGLFIFGPLLEQFWGSKRFLFFYLFTGVGAGLLNAGINYYETHQMQVAAEQYLQSPTPGKFVSFMSKYAKPIYNANYDFVNDFEEHPRSAELIRESVNFVRSFYTESVIDYQMVGASGAIFGILMAFGLLFPNTELFLLFFPFPIKAKYFVALYGLYELFGGLKQAPGDNVAHFAHLGGMLFAFILIKYWNSQRDHFY